MIKALTNEYLDSPDWIHVMTSCPLTWPVWSIWWNGFQKMPCEASRGMIPLGRLLFCLSWIALVLWTPTKFQTEKETDMKKCLFISVLSLILTMLGEGRLCSIKKEMNFLQPIIVKHTESFQVDPDRSIMQMELFGVRWMTAWWPVPGASVHIAAVSYRSKGYNGFRGYETWTDKDVTKWSGTSGHSPGASSSPQD